MRSGIYHCVSRVVERRRHLKRAEREHFVTLMRLYEEFCGVRVLSFCVMSNHFHLLLEVPPRPKEGITDKELFRRLALLYNEAKVEEVKEALRRASKAGNEEEAAAIRERYLYRMWDLSQFMKTLKQRFTQWFNRRHERKGTLWEDRFKSVIVEDGWAARVMAAYVDLNPVRAGMVARPEEYRWNGCGEAVRGKKRAREGIARVMSHYEDFGEQGERAERWKKKSWRQVMAGYREILYTDGEERMREDEATGEMTVARRGISKEEAEAVRASGGKLTIGQLLRVRVRHFVDGAVIGRQEFVDAVFEAERGRFGPRRKTGGRRIRGCETELRSLRDLQKGVD